MMSRVFIVIPAYNEEKRIGLVLEKTKKFAKDIVVVDDGSTDNTAEIAKENNAEVIRLEKNKGKGFALRAGCDYAIDKGADVIITMDADGQHEPEEIPRILQSLEGNDSVLTYRLRTKEMPLFKKIGNFGIDFITMVFFGAKIKDTQCGYRAFTADAYRKIRWKSTDYAVESETIYRMLKHKLKFVQIPIKTIYHEKNKGTGFLDGVRILFRMIKLRMFG